MSQMEIISRRPCHYYHEPGECVMLKVDVHICPPRCLLYREEEKKDKCKNSLSEFNVDCRYFQNEWNYIICTLKADSINTCKQCTEYDSVINHLPESYHDQSK